MNIRNGSEPSPSSKEHRTTICEFLGVVVFMYYNEGIHLRPHFHVVISRSLKVTIDIDTLEELSRGKLPPGRVSRLIRKWARENHDALMENWRLAREGETMKQLKPPRH